MMRRSWWLRTTVGLSALGLVAAGCAAEAPEDPEAAPAEDIDASDDATADEGPDEPAEDPATEPDEPAEDEAVPEPVDLQVTAYVVAYHWGWALFDEDGDELDALDVPVGTEVELVAVNDHASHAIEQLPDPVAEAIGQVDWHERAHHAFEEGRLPGLESELDQEGMTFSEALVAAHDGHDHMGAAQDHGLMVTGIGAEVFLDAHADEPERLVFTVEREGSHEFRCTEECGMGHENQRWEMLVASA